MDGLQGSFEPLPSQQAPLNSVMLTRSHTKKPPPTIRTQALLWMCNQYYGKSLQVPYSSIYQTQAYKIDNIIELRNIFVYYAFIEHWNRFIEREVGKFMYFYTPKFVSTSALICFSIIVFGGASTQKEMLWMKIEFHARLGLNLFLQ